MAMIKKRGDSYLIKVSCGYDLNGKQDCKFMTWKPDHKMTEKQIEKEVNLQAALFEEKCRTGQYINGNIKFADFAELWMERYAIPQLRAKTVARYKDLLIRINQGIGHIRLDRLQPQHLLAFNKSLAQGSIRKDMKFAPQKDFKAYLKEKGLTKTALAQKAGVSISVLNALTQGKNITPDSKDRICLALGEKGEDLFKPIENKNSLADKTIQHHHRLISSILSTAVEWQVISSNPCQRVRAPKVQRKEAKYLDEDEAVKLMELLDKEAPIKYRCAIYVDLCTGLRRGELCGLEWSDFDFNKNLVDIQRSSLYLAEKGIFEDDTKNFSSQRVIKLPVSVINMLKTYKKWQNNERLALGDKWQNSNRVFTAWNGSPIHPDTLTSWFSDFTKEHGFKGITLHSLRHTNATLQIASGVPIRTVSERLGHAQTSTTTNIYAHAVRSANAAAAEALEDILNPKKKIK